MKITENQVIAIIAIIGQNNSAYDFDPDLDGIIEYLEFCGFEIIEKDTDLKFQELNLSMTKEEIRAFLKTGVKKVYKTKIINIGG